MEALIDSYLTIIELSFYCEEETKVDTDDSESDD